MDAVTAIPDSEQDVSLGENPEPVTSTVDPTEAIIGLREIEGGPTVEVAV